MAPVACHLRAPGSLVSESVQRVKDMVAGFVWVKKMEVDGCCYLDGGGWVGFWGEDVGSLVEIGPKMGENRSYLHAHCHIAFQLKKRKHQEVQPKVTKTNLVSSVGRWNFPLKWFLFGEYVSFRGSTSHPFFDGRCWGLQMKNWDNFWRARLWRNETARQQESTGTGYADG